MREYKDIFFDHLNDIITLLKSDRTTGQGEALEKFELYLDTIQDIGPFDIEIWRQDWRKKIWKFGEIFRDVNPSAFILKIEEKLNNSIIKNKEVIEFIRIEIIVNFLPDTECKKQLEKLIEKYPLNPEFRNTLGHYHSRESNFLEAIREYKLACKLDPKNTTFLNSRHAKDQIYLNQLISKGEYQKGKDYLDVLSKDSKYIDNRIVRNNFKDLNRRIIDHLHFQTKLLNLENEFKDRIQKEIDSERKRIIEILGFFSAIVAFILSTVSIGKNFSFIEATYFIVSLGIILILFVVSLSVIFNSNSEKSILKDMKFWILSIGLILLFLFIIMTTSIAEIITKLT